MDELVDLIRREVEDAVAGHHVAGFLAATSYNPSTHAIKGIIMPSETETGWIPIGSNHIGNGYGLLVGPTTGSSTKLDGDQFVVQFAAGDPNTPIATHRLFSDKDKPPQVKSGEVLMLHKSGASVFLDENNNLTITGATGKNSSFKLDADGNGTLSCGSGSAEVDKDGNVTLTDAAGGVVYISGGKVYLGSKSASTAVLTTAGPSSTVFAV